MPQIPPPDAIDPEVYAALVKDHEAMVFALCRRVLGHEQDAHDATQEVFLRLCKQDPEKLRYPRAWLHTCAMNVCCDIVRRDGSRRERHRRFQIQRERDESVPTASAEVAREEVLGHLDEVVKELDPEAQDVVLAYYYEDKSLAAIGADIGLSKMGVKKRLGRALDLIRERMARRVGDVG